MVFYLPLKCQEHCNDLHVVSSLYTISSSSSLFPPPFSLILSLSHHSSPPSSLVSSPSLSPPFSLLPCSLLPHLPLPSVILLSPILFPQDWWAKASVHRSSVWSRVWPLHGREHLPWTWHGDDLWHSHHQWGPGHCKSSFILITYHISQFTMRIFYIP